MLIVHHQWRRWTKPRQQIALPGPCEVQVSSPDRGFGWGQSFDYSEDAVRTSRARLDRRPDSWWDPLEERWNAPWHPLEWRGGGREVRIGLDKPGPLRSRWEVTWHVPDWLFTLKWGQIGRVRWDGRFGPRPGIGPCFEDHVYWIGFGDPDPDMFRDRSPDLSHERLYLRPQKDAESATPPDEG